MRVCGPRRGKQLLLILFYTWVCASHSNPEKIQDRVDMDSLLYHWKWSRGSGGHVRNKGNNGGGLLCLYTAAVKDEPSLHPTRTIKPWLRCGQTIYCQGCGLPQRARIISREDIFGGVSLVNSTVTLQDDAKFQTLAILWEARNGPACPLNNCALEYASGNHHSSFLDADAPKQTPSSPVYAWHRMIGELDAAGMIFASPAMPKPLTGEGRHRISTQYTSEFMKEIQHTAPLSNSEDQVKSPQFGRHGRNLLASKSDTNYHPSNKGPLHLGASDSQYISLLQAVSRNQSHGAQWCACLSENSNGSNGQPCSSSI